MHVFYISIFINRYIDISICIYHTTSHFLLHVMNILVRTKTQYAILKKAGHQYILNPLAGQYYKLYTFIRRKLLKKYY